MAEDVFYMDEVEELMRAFGLSQVGDDSVAPRIEAVELINRTDYSLARTQLMKGLGEKMADAQEKEARVAKPWWKLW